VSPRRFMLAAAVVALSFAAACGGGSGPSVSSEGHRSSLAASDTGGNDGATGTRTITYRGVSFDVPASWPVYDLDANPTTCVRFDVHAVYLGHAGSDMQCPAGIVGRADTIHVEPADGQDVVSTNAATAGVPSTQTVNGLSVDVASGGTVTYEIDATFPSAGLAATLTYRDSDTTAQQILQSFRGVGQ
jgi:hypothetical protein